MNPEYDEFVPVDGGICPYGGWCYFCLHELPNFEEFCMRNRGATRGHNQTFPNVCKKHCTILNISRVTSYDDWIRAKELYDQMNVV